MGNVHHKDPANNVNTTALAIQKYINQFLKDCEAGYFTPHIKHISEVHE